MKIIIIILVLLFICFSVFPDTPADIAFKEYTPSFIDWVDVYFCSIYGMEGSGGDYSLSVGREVINNKYRFTFYCLYKTNDIGMYFYNNILPSVKRSVEQDCQEWTIAGYPISMNDIVFDVDAF